MKFINILLIITSALLTSCAATYLTPSSGQPVATIKGSYYATGIHNYEIARITKIDDKVTDVYDPQKEIPVTPGFHTFVIGTVFVHGFLSTRYETKTIVSAKFKADNHYKVNFKVHEKEFTVMIIDAQGKPVSSVVTMGGKPARPTILQTINYMNIIK